MKRLSFLLIALLALFASILAACGQAPAAQPTAAPQPTTAPAPSTGDGMAITGTVTLWHAYGTGSAEEKAINMLIDRARAAYPDATINVLQIPFDQIFNKFNNEVSSGGGPDMFIAPNDSLGSQIRAGVLADLSEYQSKLTDVSPTGVAGMSLDGKLYGIPESFKAVALYYNKSKVANPPATTDELLALVKAGNTLVLNQNAYHNFGWLQAFGGQLMDASGKCIADQAGGAEWFAFLKALKEVPTVTFSTDGGQADSLFKDGKADMIINGPWVLGDYRAVLGDNLGVAPMPGAAKPAGPLTGVDGFYVSINSQNVASAVALAMFLTSPESMKVYVDEAGHVPVSTKVEISDPLVQAFAQASATGVPRPQIPELDNYWGPFGDAMTKVLDGGADPAAAVAEACALMNTANGK
ncbi:extracellular solute-binding protein [Chloroflexus sp.]|uniref:extracellular solute-binding protein n=1 Tax=Chloroflexus sp. TaxID=1904827 RepID=UPI002ADD346D|nr:extracellular solute-binding protein [Chloroflexus sp.]